MNNFLKNAVSIILTIMMFISTGCDGKKMVYPIQTVEKNAPVMELSNESNVEQSELEKHFNELALKLLRESLDKNGNTMISPESIVFALTMASIGAQGETYKQMTDIVCPNATKADLNDFAKMLIDSLSKDETIHVANSVWINQDVVSRTGVTVNESYLNLLRQNFKANATVLPFNDAALKQVNDWISDETAGMIRDMLKKFSDDSFMLLINAMAFDSKWEKEYKKSQILEDAVFTDRYGKEKTHKALRSTESTYLHGFDATGILKNYEGGRYAFMAMLPDDNTISLADYISGLPDDAFSKFYNSRKSADVITQIPCFNFDYEIGMKEVLEKMGMTRPFNENTAEFFDMLEEGSYDPENTKVWIERVLHKTHIELDENGTKAAAATIVEMGMKCESVGPAPEPYMVILDRPFIFAIMDLELGVPVFVGTVENP